MKRERLYAEIAPVLRRKIRSDYKENERFYSEHELAMQFKVSVSTVREAILLLCHEGVLERRHGVGLFVKRSKEEKHIAIIAKMTAEYINKVFPYLITIQSLMDMFGTHGYCTRLYTGEWTPEYIDTIPEFGEFISDLRRDKIIGAVAITAPGTWMADITSKKIPIVGSAYEYQYGAGHDYCHMVREGVRFLADKKRTKIGFLGWLDPKYPPSKAMADAFRKELHQHGLRYEPAWFRGDMHPCLRGAGWAAFREIWSANEKPDGLLITDSVLYQGAINAVLGLKINVPDELMILTQANTGEDTVYPFPTVRMEYDPHEYAAAIGTLLLKLIKKETVRAPRQYLKFKWVNRNLAETMPCLAERA